MSLLKNKKSQEIISDIGFLLFSIMGLSAIIFTLYFLSSSNIAQAAQIPNGAEELSIKGFFINSKDCFSYVDGNGKTEINSIDLSKFNKDTLDRCYDKGNNIAFQFRLFFDGAEKDIETINWLSGRQYAEEQISVNVYSNQERNTDIKLRIRTQNAK